MLHTKNWRLSPYSFFTFSKGMMMKAFSVLIAVLSVATTVVMLARPAFVPANAYWRIDRHDVTPMDESGHWTEIGEFPGENGGGDWGQGRCDGGGNDCHLNDYCTWWFTLATPPSPPSGYTPVEFGSSNFPIGL